MKKSEKLLRALLIKGDSILNYTDEVKKIRESIKNEEELEYFVNFVRGIVQKEARVAEKNNPTKRSIIALATGSGKSKIAVDCIRDNHSSIEDTYHIFVPTEKLRDENWKEEFSNWGQLETLQKYVETHCYASASKVFSPSTVNYAILDEGHNITELSAKYFTNNIVDRAVLLTATVPKSEEKKRILEELDFKVVYELSLDDAVKLGFVAPYKITVVTVPLNKVDKNFKAGSAKKPFMTTEFANMEYLNELYEHTPIGKRFRIALTRMRAIHNLPSKREAAKFILDNVIPKEDRTLIFASNIEQANYLCENTFHSKVASKDYDAFKAGEINRLSCVLAVNEGQNFPNLNSGLIVQLNSNDKDLIQRIGRLVRFRVGHEASLYVVVAENTQDMVWLRLATEGIDASNIEYVSFQELKNKYKN